MSAPDVVDLLLDQHTQVKDLMNTVTGSTGEARAKAFGALAELLERHERGEQQTVHTALRDELGLPDVAGEVAAEEQRADGALARLRDLDVDSAEFETEFGAFQAAVLDHAAREEREEFPRLRESLHPSALLALADDLRAVQ